MSFVISKRWVRSDEINRSHLRLLAAILLTAQSAIAELEGLGMGISQIIFSKTISITTSCRSKTRPLGLRCPICSRHRTVNQVLWSRAAPRNSTMLT